MHGDNDDDLFTRHPVGGGHGVGLLPLEPAALQPHRVLVLASRRRRPWPSEHDMGSAAAVPATAAVKPHVHRRTYGTGPFASSPPSAGSCADDERARRDKHTERMVGNRERGDIAIRILKAIFSCFFFSSYPSLDTRAFGDVLTLETQFFFILKKPMLVLLRIFIGTYYVKRSGAAVFVALNVSERPEL